MMDHSSSFPAGGQGEVWAKFHARVPSGLTLFSYLKLDDEVSAMRLLVIFLPLLLLGMPVKAQSIFVPSDPKAAYSVVGKPTRKGSDVVAVTKRVGPSGTSYSRRLVDCSSMTFRYLGEGDTLAEAMQDRGGSQMGDLVPGSISTYVALHVCKR